MPYDLDLFLRVRWAGSLPQSVSSLICVAFQTRTELRGSRLRRSLVLAFLSERGFERSGMFLEISLLEYGRIFVSVLLVRQYGMTRVSAAAVRLLLPLPNYIFNTFVSPKEPMGLPVLIPYLSIGNLSEQWFVSERCPGPALFTQREFVDVPELFLGDPSGHRLGFRAWCHHLH